MSVAQKLVRIIAIGSPEKPKVYIDFIDDAEQDIKLPNDVLYIDKVEGQRNPLDLARQFCERQGFTLVENNAFSFLNKKALQTRAVSDFDPKNTKSWKAMDIKKAYDDATIPSDINPETRASPTRPKITECNIADLLKKYGWAVGSWQDKILRLYDNGDGFISASEMKDVFSDNKKRSVISSNQLYAIETKIAKNQSLNEFEQWAAHLADQNANKDGKYTSAEFFSYGKKLATSSAKKGDMNYITQQRLIILRHAIAQITQEEDIATNIKIAASTQQAGAKISTLTLMKPALVNVYNPFTGSFFIAQCGYFFADRYYSPGTKRSDKFFTEKCLTDRGLGISKNVYSGPESLPGEKKKGFFKIFDHIWEGIAKVFWAFDKGHSLARNHFITQRDADGSFGIDCMSPQTGPNNQNVWRLYAEELFQERAEEHRGRFLPKVFSLYHDIKLKLLPKDKIVWIKGQKGAGGHDDNLLDQVAVPTFSCGAFLEQYPDEATGKNKFRLSCVIVANKMDLNRKAKPTVVETLSENDNKDTRILKIAQHIEDNGCAIISLADMELILENKVDLFANLPKEIKKEIYNDPQKEYTPKEFIDFIVEAKDDGDNFFDLQNTSHLA